jgi:hypothetical protein
MLDASREVVLEVMGDRTKCMLMSRQQNAGQRHNIKIANKPFENMSNFKYSNESKLCSRKNEEYIQFSK